MADEQLEHGFSTPVFPATGDGQRTLPGGDPRIDTRLGKYHLLAPIGRGGMGVVYVAQDTLLGRQVAIKLLPPAVVEDAERLRRLLREARLVARLNHPNVITLHEIAQEAAAWYLVMELAEGGSLQEALATGRSLGWREATRLMAEACRGLAATHAAGLLHRDLKPANLLLSREGVVKLADFGLARAAELENASTSGMGDQVGTPHYMSPEQCRGEPTDERTDIYGAGATYFTLLTGRPPFPGRGMGELVTAHCSLAAPDPRTVDPTVPPECAAIVLRAMAKSPAQRYASARELQVDLEAAGRAGSSEYPLRIQADFPGRTARPRLQKAWMAAMIGFLLLGVAGLFLASEMLARRPVPTTVLQATATLDALGPVTALAFSGDGQSLAWGTSQGARLVAGLRDPVPLRGQTQKPVRAIALSSANAHWVASYEDGSYETWRDWTSAQGEYTRLPHTLEGQAKALAYSPTRDLLAVVGVHLDGRSGLVRLYQYASRKYPDTIAHPEAVWALAFSPTGLLVLGGESGTLTVLDPEKAERVGGFRSGVGKVLALAYAGPRKLAVGGAEAMELWDLDLGRVCFRGEGECASVTCSADGRLLAWAKGPTAEVWDIQEERPLARLVGHQGRIRAVALDTVGHTLVTGGADETIRLWDLKVLERR